MHSDADFLVDVWETESDGKDSLKAVGLSPTRPPGIHTSLFSDKKKMNEDLLMQRDSIYSLPVMSVMRGIGGYCGVLQYPLLRNDNSYTCIECKGCW